MTATPEKVLAEKLVGNYRVQLFNYPYGPPELVYRVLVETQPGVWEKVCCRTRYEEKMFPKRAAKAGNEMV